MSDQPPFNIADTLRETARRFPAQPAVLVCSRGGARSQVATSPPVTFAQLDAECDRLAEGLRQLGVRPGDRLVLAVRPGPDFLRWTFALFRSGATVVLLDPGMGLRRIFQCLDQIDPAGFIGPPRVQWLRWLQRRRFARARFNITVGPAPWGPGLPVDRLLALAPATATPFPTTTRRQETAAIIFTSGSTGPPKGVVYQHGMFAAQIDALRDTWQIPPGGIDLAAFPLFGLFNIALGLTTLVPPMDASRPGRANPAWLVRALRDHQVEQSFASPAVWKRVGDYCRQHQVQLPSLRRVFSAGAPVSPAVLETMAAALTAPDAAIYTPYGATEALPVAAISASTVLTETAALTRQGAGTCVGNPIGQIAVRIVRVTDGPLGETDLRQPLPVEALGEIVVRGPVVTQQYFQLPEATGLAKAWLDGECWHRMGDIGYFDRQGRLWFCGRKSQRVETPSGVLWTDRVEPIFNTHPDVTRTALVGVGPRPRQQAVVVVETRTHRWSTTLLAELRKLALAHQTTRELCCFVHFPRPLPVDVRHNTKIQREWLGEWASRQRLDLQDTT